MKNESHSITVTVWAMRVLSRPSTPFTTAIFSPPQSCVEVGPAGRFTTLTKLAWIRDKILTKSEQEESLSTKFEMGELKHGPGSLWGTEVQSHAESEWE